MERPGAIADRPSVARWPIAAGVGVALTGPTLAIVAGELWGMVVALVVTVVGGPVLALLVALAVHQRDAWLRALARQATVRRAAMDVAMKNTGSREGTRRTQPI